MALTLRSPRASALPQSGPAGIVSLDALLKNRRVARALAGAPELNAWTTEQQVRLTEVPAPTFQEAARAELLRKLLLASGLRPRVDAAGNVVAERPGDGRKDVVLISAHLDTVFPPGIPVKVKKDGRRLEGPGISDNGAGLASLLCLARTLQQAKIHTQSTLVFAANTGEEGEGNLRGMRKLVETYRNRLRAVIAVDGAATDHITTTALASRRLEVTLTGSGGHSWADFGMPNPVHAMARGVARFLNTRLPVTPRTTYNVGVIEGGTSVNTIPQRALVKVDLRSESPAELDRLESALRKAMDAGVSEEMAAAKEAGHGGDPRIEIDTRSLGERPGGALPEDAPLLAAVRQADRYLENESRLEVSSTDANIPLSLGIPAISLGGGGRSGGAHSPAEWYDATGRDLGAKRILLTVLAVAGIEP
jgi:acetylornithine deacetylase/succinyl-diaminopimelate desuccinylase-like protein